jgi:hypothetical protein
MICWAISLVNFVSVNRDRRLTFGAAHTAARYQGWFFEDRNRFVNKGIIKTETWNFVQ